MSEPAVWRIWNIYPRTNLEWCGECGPRAECGEVDGSNYSETPIAKIFHRELVLIQKTLNIFMVV